MEERIQDSDYESVRDLVIYCKKEGINLADLVSAIRIKNYIKQIGADEGRVEQFIARCTNSQDTQLVDVLDKIWDIDVPLEGLEEHIKLKRVEKETLLHEMGRQYYHGTAHLERGHGQPLIFIRGTLR